MDSQIKGAKKVFIGDQQKSCKAVKSLPVTDVHPTLKRGSKKACMRNVKVIIYDDKRGKVSRSVQMKRQITYIIRTMRMKRLSMK